MIRTSELRLYRRHRSALGRSAGNENGSRSGSDGPNWPARSPALWGPPSTITREIDANGGRDGYRAHVADRRALGLAWRPNFVDGAGHARGTGPVMDRG